MRHNRSYQSAGFALVLTLIILTLLAIAVVGFLSGSVIDRSTAQAFSNRSQAESAAQGAVNRAISLVSSNIAKYPDSVTSWEWLVPPGNATFNLPTTQPAQSSNAISIANAAPSRACVEGTMLYYWDQPPGTAGAQRWMLPLLSTGLDANGQPIPAQTMDKRRSALGTAEWNDDNSIDINRPRFNGDLEGWVGAPPDGRRELRAKWINIKADDTATAKTIARYAFWVEDESFRVNMNLLGQTTRGSNTPGLVPGEIPYQGLIQSVRCPTSDPTEFAKNLYNLRTLWSGQSLPEMRTFNYAPFPNDSATNPYRIADQARFLGTIYSSGLNLSRHGSQRVNLNGLGFDQVGQGADAQMKGLKQIVQTIKYHAPNFGERFYRSSTSSSPAILNRQEVGTGTNSLIYFYKVAANIKDYIDVDSLPTIVMANNGATDGVLAPQTQPTNAMHAEDGTNDVWAQGKDAGPFVQEALQRFRVKISPPANGSRTNTFDLRVDYYIEFWNMSNVDVYAAPQPDNPSAAHLSNAFVLVADQVSWAQCDSNGTAGAPLRSTSPNVSLGTDGTLDRDLIISLTDGVYPLVSGGPTGTQPAAQPIKSGVVFKAGTCTVITTDPDGLPQTLDSGATQVGPINSKTTYYCSKFNHGWRHFQGDMPIDRTTGASATAVEPVWREPDLTEDYGTEVVLGNSFGYVDSMPYAITGGGKAPVTDMASASHNPRDTGHGGSLFGNGTTASQLGDPRTNNEQLVMTRYKSGSTNEPDQTRYFNETGGYTLGYPDSNYVNPSSGNRWPDYYKGWDTTPIAQQPAAAGPAYIANANLQSIGQLGDIFDPARVKGATGTLGVNAARGGGRTFRIGQVDDRIDQTGPTAVSRQWASYRLTDFFGVNNNLELPGVININGVRRDNGAALRAACYGMTIHNQSTATSAGTDSQLNTDEVTATGVQELVRCLVARMNANDPDPSAPLKTTAGATASTYFGPLSERGEMGELGLFSPGTTPGVMTVGTNTALTTGNLLSGTSMDTAFDRTREELTRRLIELVTTRGDTFSVYAVGQAISEGPPPARTQTVTATRQLKVTFRLVPVWSRVNGTTGQITKEDWDPTDDTSRKDRFAAPDHYDVQILQVSS